MTEVSFRSRAARRQSSPPPLSGIASKSKADDAEQPWLYHAQNAGISKKKKAKQLTRQQRLRQQKGMEHAERNIDKLEKKLKDSKQRGKKVQERRAQWDDLNGTVRASLNDNAEEDVKEDEPRENWTTKIVDVELAEATGEIEDFELPQQQPAEPEIRKGALDSMFGNGEKPVETPTKNDVDDIDDIS